jgi:hypothetical protein
MTNFEIISVDVSTIRLKFNHDMEYFKGYIQFNKEKLEERQKILHYQLQSDIEDNPNDADTLMQIYDDDFKRIPAYFYHSSVISLFTLLEYSLNQTCLEIILRTKMPIQLKDLAGTNILNKARIFLSKLCNIHLRTFEKEWIQVSNFQRIRNLIVHHNSHVDPGNANNIRETNDYKILQDFKDVNVDLNTGKFLITNHNIIERYYDLIDSYVNSLFDEVSKKQFKLFGIDYDKYQDDLYNEQVPHSMYFRNSKNDSQNDSFLDDLPF